MTSDNVNNKDDCKSYEKVGLIYNAIIENKKEIFAEKLLQTEGDINYKISEGSQKVPNLLHTALETDGKYFNLLLEYGADFTYKNEKGKTIIYAAISDSKIHSNNLDLIFDAHVKFNNSSNPSDNNGITHFHAACMKNNSVAVEFFLANGVDVNLAINADSSRFASCTPLHLAVKYICLDVVEILLKHGANIHLKNAAGFSPLHLIIKKKLKGSNDDETENEKCRQLLEIFAKFMIKDDATNINVVDHFGISTFHVHCILQDDSFIASIIKRIADINLPVNSDSPIYPGYNALHFAVFSNVRMFKLLLKNGANVEAKNTRGQTPLDLYLQNHTVEEVHSILLTKLRWKNIVLSDNETTLIDIVSAMESTDKFASFLKDNESNLESALNLFVPLDSPLWPGYTLLHLAVLFNDGSKKTQRGKKSEFALINECLKRGAKMTTKDAKGLTAIHLAFYLQKEKIVKFLLDRYNKPNNLADENNWSLLHIASLVEHEKAVEHLLSNGADVNSQVNSTFEYESREECDKHFFICPGSTPLHINIPISKNYKVTQILLSYGADVNAQDVNGFTPLHRIMSIESYKDKYLLAAKSLKNVVLPCGLSHLHVASIAGNTEAIEKLLKLGADINAPVMYKSDASSGKNYKREFYKDPYGDPREPLAFLSQYAGSTPLHIACETHSIDTPKTIRCLLKRNADVFAKNEKGTFALANHLSRLDDREEYFEVINRSVNFQKFLEKQYGITMLHVACRYGEFKLVKSLIRGGANVNAKINSDSPIWRGYTPLHFIVKIACEKYYVKIVIDQLGKIVRLMAKHGADVLSVDSSNNTPIHFIKHLDFHPIGFQYKISAISPLFLRLFKSIQNVNVNPANNQRLSVFHVACLTLNETIIEKYLTHDVDVNQAISYFSKIYPGSTPLHLIIKQYRELHNESLKCALNDKTFLRLIDLMLEKGANVNATDASRNTPLHEAVQLSGLRQSLIKKLISNGADVHAANVFYNTAFENLLLIGDATLEEIDLFLNAGANFNTYNPISQTGYMAIFLHHRGIRSAPAITENQLVLRMIDNPKIIEINHLGRTVIHNLVSIKWKKEYIRTCSMLVKLFHRAAVPGFGGKKNSETNDSVYAEMIEQLLIRGCDIDYQDNEGKTALHLAVAFRNNRAIIQLLKNGADINAIDRSGKTAFAYCREPTDRDGYPWYHKAIDWDKNYANKLFASLVYKLKYCKQPVNEQNEQLKMKVVENLGPIKGESLKCFHSEMRKSESIKIGNTSLTLHQFLTKENMPEAYANMTNEERQELDEFSENIDKYNFREIDCLVKWKYRKTIERTRLYESAVTSLNILINYQLPDVISRIIMKFLTNEDLKRLIYSVN